MDGIAIDPSEGNSDAVISGAVRALSEKDTFVNAGQIRFAVNDFVEIADGVAPIESALEMAVFNGWYVFGVDDVVTCIKVG